MSADLYAIVRRPIYGQGQSVAYTGTAGTITNSLPQGCQSVAVQCTTAAYVKVGVSPTATTADLAIPGNVLVVLPIDAPSTPTSGGQLKVSAVQVSAGGTLYVMPLAD